MWSGCWFEVHIKISRWPASDFLKNGMWIVMCGVWEVKTKEAFSTEQCQRKQKYVSTASSHISDPRGTFAIDTSDLFDLLRFSMFSALFSLPCKIHSLDFHCEKWKLIWFAVNAWRDQELLTDRFPMHFWNGHPLTLHCSIPVLHEIPQKVTEREITDDGVE